MRDIGALPERANARRTDLAVRRPDGSPELPTEAMRRPWIIGMCVIGVLFGLGGAWATFAPLQSATIAAGVVSPEGRRRAVQALDGGMLAQVRVKEGDLVQKGQVVALLEDVRTQAERRAALRLVRQFAALEARLRAEQRGAETIDFSHASLRDSADPEVISIIEAEKRQAESRSSGSNARRKVLVQRIAQNQARIEGTRRRIGFTETQIALLGEEIATVKGLMDRGLAARPRYLELQRRQAELSGVVEDLKASISSAEEAITATRMELVNVKSEDDTGVGAQLSEARARLATAEQALATIQDRLEKTAIRAPIEGAVFGLKHASPGAVIGPGEVLLELVPVQSQLIVEARVRPSDIDSVRLGQSARVTFSSIRQERGVSFIGEVVERGADVNVDRSTGNGFYTVSVRIDREELTRKAPNFNVVVGMPAQVYLQGNQRTFAQYLGEPITDLMQRGLKEE